MVRVWGRGEGEKPSSSAGGCAVVVAGALSGRTERRLLVHLRGGDLEVDWARDGAGHIYVTGPVVEIPSDA
jgi:diaminopimelate epimerase